MAYATTATGGTQIRDGIKRRLGLGTEESDDAGESYVTKTGVGTGVGFGTENNLKNSRENSFDTRFGNGTNLRLQTVSYRDGIGRLGTWREKQIDDRESFCTKTGVGTGVGFAIKSNRKNSMKKHKETREGIGTMAGICAKVAIGKCKGMNSGNAFYWMLVKVQGQDQMMEQVRILIWIQSQILLVPLIVILVKVHVGKLEVEERHGIAYAFGKLGSRFRSNR